MRFLIVKIFVLLLALFLLCLPYLPWKLGFTLSSARYQKKNSWKNIAFVIETLLVGGILLCFAPFIKMFFLWLFNLDFMKWLLGKLSDRTTYTIETVAMLVMNLALAFLFVILKTCFRGILDTYIFKNNPQSEEEETDLDRRLQRRKKKNRARHDEKNRKKRDLKKLRRESLLVFDAPASPVKVEKLVPEEYKTPKKKAEENKQRVLPSDTERVSLGELIKRLWFGFIGLFYRKEDRYETVKPGTYRWANQLYLFGIMFGFVCLVFSALILLPVIFPVNEDAFVYDLGLWFLNNSYACPVIALVLLCELYWFLGGEYKQVEEAEAPFVSFVDRLNQGNEVSLEKAKEKILTKYGKNYKIHHFETEPTGGTSTYRLQEKKQAIQNMAAAIRADKGFVNEDYLRGLEYMFNGDHVLFDTVLYSALGEYVLHYLFVTLSFGRRVLFICKDKQEMENVAGYLEDSFRRITKSDHILWRICTYEELHEGQNPDILLLTPEQFLEPTLFTDGARFFEELEDVFVLDVDKILTANNYYCLIMVKKLEKAAGNSHDMDVVDADQKLAVGKKVLWRFFSSGHIQSLENSIRQFFDLGNAPLQMFHSFGLANRTEVFVWHTGMTPTLYVDNGANQVSLEMQIAKDAAELKINDINIITDTAIYSSQRNEIEGLVVNSAAQGEDSVGYVIVADDDFNLPSAIYNFVRFSGKKASVLHVVSKPYLLREYFTSQAEQYASHFELIGKTMSEHAHIRRVNIINLLCDAVNGIERTEFLKRASVLLGNCACSTETEYDLEDCVRLCYRAAFGEDCECEPQYSLLQRQDSKLQNKTFVYLKDSDQLFEKLLESTRAIKLEFINTQGEEYLPIFRDEITQHFVPGQVIVLHNHGYTIKSMSVEEGTLVLDDTVPSVNVPMDYVQTRLYTVSNAELKTSFGQDYRAINSEVIHADFRIYDADITADTLGYYSIEKALQSVDLTKPNFAKYTSLRDNADLRAQLQRNIHSNMLILELDTVSDVSPRAGYLLAVMLQEFMKTIFPHQYRCVSVCYLFEDGADETFFDGEIAIRDLYPWMKSFDEKIAKTEDAKSAGGKLRLAIVEDIQGGNGVVEALTDGNGIMVTNLLHIAADFLQWLKSPEGEDYQYLRFGYEQTPAVFDFEALETLISQFHHQVERSELVRISEEDACFFCHRPLEGGQGQRLSDGRLICDRCKETSVQTYEALEKIFEQVMQTIKESTTAADSFPTPIAIDFVSTMELRDRYGEDKERLPIAYCDHVANRIYVEYGLPKATLCCCIARCVTELWQDLNVADDGGAQFRAHPELVEIQVLSRLHMDVEAQMLEAYYAASEGLAELKKALQELGHNDSFAYFLGAAGRNTVETPSENPEEEDISFIAERNPEGLVKMHYSTLNEDERAIYDQIYQGALEFAEKTAPLVCEIAVDRCIEIMNAVLYDNPELFWCGRGLGSVSYNSAGIATGVIFKYIMTPAEAKRRKKQIENAIRPFLTGIKPSMSDYEAALHTYENIVKLIDYDTIGMREQEIDPKRDDKPDNLRSIYGVFVEKKAVCAGYARAFQYITNRLGIQCSYVRGKCHDGGWHAWNIIKLEGDYYYVDSTWDDKTDTDEKINGLDYVWYDYFCVTTEEILRSRGIQNQQRYPACTQTKCNYHVRNDLYFETYDAARLQKLITAGIKAGKKHFCFKAKDAKLLALMESRLITDCGFLDILDSAGVNKNLSYHYSVNETMNGLHIFLK